MLILNTAQVAIDLLEKRARIYSDRGMTNMAKLSGSESVFSLQRYSDKWRGNRKFFQQHFRKSACSRFYAAQYKKIHQFLHNLMDVPEEFMHHTMSLSQGLIYAVLYGLDVGSEDPLAQKAVETMDLLAQAVNQHFCKSPDS
ncbi:hypothetical protein BDP27DRAFT_1208940 [Rhodocollybia butyracea]|uniref:Cytochrome P450 n=1 Tax=Rhodocollybia butyracea TaxID=206335 RepID=A0A9P5UFN1_9AGAR|nr:hypothetical protein BDP27DRAFT_1208940 [Rhodocollybia butyracea]